MFLILHLFAPCKTGVDISCYTRGSQPGFRGTLGCHHMSELDSDLLYYKLWLGVPPNCSITRKGYRESRLRTTVLHYSHMSWLPPFPLEWSERSNCGHGWEQWGSTEIYFDYSIFFQFKIMIVQKKNFCRWFMNTFVTSKRKIFIKRMLIINIFKYKIYLTPLPDLGLPNQLIKSFNWRTATDLCYVKTSVMQYPIRFFPVIFNVKSVRLYWVSWNYLLTTFLWSDSKNKLKIDQKSNSLKWVFGRYTKGRNKLGF